MTDLEISKALALAIGWGRVQITDDKVLVYTGNPSDRVWVWYSHRWVYNNRVFDYKDWNVIGPIAEKFDCFPMVAACHADQWAIVTERVEVYAETPQKAIALAVIQATNEPH